MVRPNGADALPMLKIPRARCPAIDASVDIVPRAVSKNAAMRPDSRPACAAESATLAKRSAPFANQLVSGPAATATWVKASTRERKALPRCPMMRALRLPMRCMSAPNALPPTSSPARLASPPSASAVVAITRRSGPKFAMAALTPAVTPGNRFDPAA
jgi:hypothetical protein